MPIAAVINGQIYAVSSDHLNTPRRLTDSTGQPVWQWAYSAFGDEAPTIAGRRFANVPPGPGDFDFNLRYWGMYGDKESGLYHNWNRSYCPACGRYTQPDRVGLCGGPNRYPYANLNPLTYSDPNGLNPLAGAIGGATAGSAFGPVGTVVGGVIGGSAGAWIGWNVFGPMLSEEGGPIVYPDNPDAAPDKFRPINGSRGKQCEDGSVWERDTSSHGGDQWKRWPDQKSWEKGRPPNSIWPDGRIRK
jgi:RHS repeat-associated protein